MANNRKNKLDNAVNNSEEEVGLSVEKNKNQISAKNSNDNSLFVNKTEDVKIKVNMLLSEKEHFLYQACCKANKMTLQDQLKELALEWIRREQHKLSQIKI